MSKADAGREQESELPTFDDFVALLASDPEGFEALRTTLIENEIANAPLKDQRRLRGIQFQVDCARRASKNPIASCVKIQKMLHESAEELKSLVQYHCAPPTAQLIKWTLESTHLLHLRRAIILSNSRDPDIVLMSSLSGWGSGQTYLLLLGHINREVRAESSCFW